MWSLYVHINKINGKRYYGITSRDPKERWGKNGNGYKKHLIFYNAIKKYKWENFEHKILATDLTEEEAKECEEYYIELYKTNVIKWKDKSNGYNMSDGGEGCKGPHPTMIGNKNAANNKGGRPKRKHSEDEPERKHNESGFKGKHHSKETRDKMSENRRKEKNSFFGHNHTEDAKEKSRLKHSKPIRNKITGKEYLYGIKEVSKDIGRSINTIRKYFNDWGFEYM